MLGGQHLKEILKGGEKVGIFRKKRNLVSMLLTMNVNGTETDKEKAKETLEMKLDDYRSKFRLDPEAGPDLAKRLVALSALYRNSGDADKSAAFRNEAMEVINSAHYPDNETGNEVKRLAKIL